jgi:hypothetical protein
MTHTNVAVIESKWWNGTNVSVRGLFDLMADIACENPHAYHYEMANSEAALKEAIPRIAEDKDCRYLCLAMHGDIDGLHLFNNERLTRTELRNLFGRIYDKRGARLTGVHMASCLFGTHDFADWTFSRKHDVVWIAGYSTEVAWIESSALDLLFFNTLINGDPSETEVQRIQRTAKRLSEIAPGLIKELGFGVYVRKQRTGGAKNLFDVR